MSVANLARTVVTCALDLLLPPTCLACDEPVAKPGQLCAACFRAITFLGDPCCACCGHGFAHVGQASADLPDTGLVCARCAAQPPAWGRARGALLYDAASRGLVLRLKYADQTEHARPLAAMMARAGAALLRDADLLVPVPLHWRRLLGRRFNQSALLARALSPLAGRPVVVDALVRSRRTASLGHLGAIARAAEVHSAFVVRPSRLGLLQGSRVLLIDDVLTSGATAEACTSTLLAAGVLAVDVLVAARVGHTGMA